MLMLGAITIASLTWNFQGAIYRAVINSRYYIESVVNPAISHPMYYTVIDRTNNSRLNYGPAMLEANLNNGFFNTAPPTGSAKTITWKPTAPPPEVPTPKTPIEDPGPNETNQTTGNFYEDNKYYIYAAAAILGIAFYINKRK